MLDTEPEYVEEVDPALLPPYQKRKQKPVPVEREETYRSTTSFPGSYTVTVADYSDGTHKMEVYLPHQCDEFVVASGPTLEAVVAELEEFVAHTQTIIDSLKEVL